MKHVPVLDVIAFTQHKVSPVHALAIIVHLAGCRRCRRVTQRAYDLGPEWESWV